MCFKFNWVHFIIFNVTWYLCWGLFINYKFSSHFMLSKFAICLFIIFPLNFLFFLITFVWIFIYFEIWQLFLLDILKLFLDCFWFGIYLLICFEFIPTHYQRFRRFCSNIFHQYEYLCNDIFSLVWFTDSLIVRKQFGSMWRGCIRLILQEELGVRYKISNAILLAETVCLSLEAVALYLTITHIRRIIPLDTSSSSFACFESILGPTTYGTSRASIEEIFNIFWTKRVTKM